MVVLFLFLLVFRFCSFYYYIIIIIISFFLFYPVFIFILNYLCASILL